MFQSLPRPSRRFLIILASILIPLYIEAFLHWRTFDIPRPSHDLDPAFQTGCREPDVHGRRENAALVMLAQNSEIDAAKRTVDSVEAKFNRWFHYPYVFLNDKPWDPEFVRIMNQTVSGEARFEVIPDREWNYPEWIDKTAAQQSILEQGERGVHYGGREGYHHMCRFFSGYVRGLGKLTAPNCFGNPCVTDTRCPPYSKFYTLEALRRYKWYWRLEPDVEFSCSITYDPFVKMAQHKQVYGWTMSLWEEGNTCPSLFRHMADWKEANLIPTTSLWKAMMSASWLPYPFRRWLSWLPHHDKLGDVWSMCHYWSNFEIADLDFFRSKSYQDLFNYLDQKEGFYHERVRRIFPTSYFCLKHVLTTML